jgi:hypothetical protein
MRFYGADYWDVLKWPLKTFWSMQRQVDRLRAEEDQRSLQIAAAVQGGEAAVKLQEELARQIGEPVVKEMIFNTDQFDKLKEKFKGLQ